MKTYKLNLKQNEYITQAQRKYFKIALEWYLSNKCDCCKVNRTCYNFDFDKMKVNIIGVGYGNNTYNIKEVNDND